MTYRAPVEDILFAMRHAAGLEQGIASGLYADLADGTAEAVLEEAAKFAESRIAPLNRGGDKETSRLVDGSVITPKGFREAYTDWAAGGWAGVAAAPAHGGQGLPILLNIGCTELWNAANLAFALNPLLTMGAVEALTAHGSEHLQKTYLEKMISGEWTGTMNLTEPQAGSDLALLTSRAERNGDGTYRIFGQKIFITYGDHDLTGNIVHLVLARLPDAPPGTRGISLFVVPKFIPKADGTPGERNDVRCHALEHKLGIHASPTATMIYGDRGGALGWLVGEENKGLACMFTMMNNARLAVGVQGVAVADRACQQAFAYAHDRKQGKATGATATSPIVEHPDVRRMLIEMRSKTAAARAICLVTAAALDRHHRLEGAEARAAHEEASLLTPVAKAFSTDIGVEVASLGVQIHGGMGFVEETGAAQHYRDARILPIYEGTNGIQAIDLVTRKLPLSEGRTVKAVLGRYARTVAAARAINHPAFARIGLRLGEGLAALDRATDFMLAALASKPNDALAGATPYLRLFGLVAGGAYLADQALAAHAGLGAGETDPRHHTRIADARFFAENLVTAASGLEMTILEGADSVNVAWAAE
ncbi:MAG: acyl-CoA dehydrogenase [Methylobacterium sp.]|nr:acyl-CoA dehydrogenase [Methylobacterium sp.]MCA3639115.1 acyl-CoA dehydrogenase [Methylobacterium sp.]MCA3646262.1 acyl-CoA dehydrogenase [Methylobacterium sp.]MCA3651368.1 acyl-CoA dehydrogenase [Methylobacterium sp.]MCA4923745.1 acyl-CoA dehydrogenase [Methylobacterium sp.]